MYVSKCVGVYICACVHAYISQPNLKFLQQHARSVVNNDHQVGFGGGECV